jgi:heme/copper-type cytochrome/quinol oxidase subunit 2
MAIDRRRMAPLPYFGFVSSLIAIWPFRHLWNNPPQFVGNHVWLAILTALTVYFIVAFGLMGLMMICWIRWRSNKAAANEQLTGQ